MREIINDDILHCQNSLGARRSRYFGVFSTKTHRQECLCHSFERSVFSSFSLSISPISEMVLAVLKKKSETAVEIFCCFDSAAAADKQSGDFAGAGHCQFGSYFYFCGCFSRSANGAKIVSADNRGCAQRFLSRTLGKLSGFVRTETGQLLRRSWNRISRNRICRT